VASEEYQRDLKKIYTQLEEPRGSAAPELAELREEKWERTLGANSTPVRRAIPVVTSTPVTAATPTDFNESQFASIPLLKERANLRDDF
jgi:hypothetical protein